jgi:hypothetical protein
MKLKRKSKRFTLKDRLEDLLASHEEQIAKLRKKQDEELYALWFEAYKINPLDPICQTIWEVYADGNGMPMPSFSYR